nr:MAG TPA: hypothetical protein [Caudoviricetes sp.]
MTSFSADSSDSSLTVSEANCQPKKPVKSMVSRSC